MLSDDTLSTFLTFIASIFVIGSIIGSVAGGFQTKYLGRKYSMMLDCLITLSGLVCIRLSQSFSMLLIGRFITGYSNGSNKTSILPYTSEICQPQIRKFTGTLFSLFEQSGMAFIYMLGALLDWKTAVLVTTVWPCITFTLLVFCPQSPTWLMVNGREKDAYKTMKRLRGNEPITKCELERIQKNIEKQPNHHQSTSQNASVYKRVSDLIICGTFLRPFLIIVVLYAIGLQWTGAPFLSFYLVYVIKQNNISVNPYWISAGLFGYRVCLSVLSSLITPFTPRRRLFLCTSFILATGGLLIGTIAHLSNISWFIDAQNNYPIMKWLPILSIGVLYTGIFALLCCHLSNY